MKTIERGHRLLIRYVQSLAKDPAGELILQLPDLSFQPIHGHTTVGKDGLQVGDTQQNVTSRNVSITNPVLSNFQQSNYL
jgi:hypothetical protein